jgi:hypothetical protein
MASQAATKKAAPSEEKDKTIDCFLTPLTQMQNAFCNGVVQSFTDKVSTLKLVNFGDSTGWTESICFSLALLLGTHDPVRCVVVLPSDFSTYRTVCSTERIVNRLEELKKPNLRVLRFTQSSLRVCKQSHPGKQTCALCSVVELVSPKASAFRGKGASIVFFEHMSQSDQRAVLPCIAPLCAMKDMRVVASGFTSDSWLTALAPKSTTHAVTPPQQAPRREEFVKQKDTLTYMEE